MTSAGASDREEIRRLLSSSTYYLKLADSILSKLDRKTLADLIASYLYFKSRGKTNSEFARFVLAERLPFALSIVFGIGVPVILPAIVSDKTFRNLIIDIVLKSLAKTKN